jgi:outer membrane protein TolC
LLLALQCQAEVVTPSAVHRLAGSIPERHPGLQALELRAGAAQAQAEATRRWADPTLRAGGIGFTSRGPLASEEGDIALGITQTLPVFGKESSARTVAQAEAKTARETAEVRIPTLQRDLMERLLDLALIHRSIDLAEADRVWLQRISDTLETRHASGKVSAPQLLLIRNELSQAETRLKLLRIDTQDAAARINRVLGHPIDRAVGSWELPAKAAPITYQPDWPRHALTAEPQLRVARTLSAEASARVEATRRSRRPNLSLGLDSRQYSGDGGLRNGAAILSVSLPWFNGDQYRKDLTRDRLRLEAAHREVANLEAEVTLEIHHWLTRIESARIRAELAEETLLPRIRAALDSATAALSAGPGELRDTLDLRRQWLDAQSSQATAIADQWSAIAELLLLCGWHDLPHPPSPPSRPSPAP